MSFASDKTSHTNLNTCLRCLQHYFVDLDLNCLDVGHVWPFLNDPQVRPPHCFFDRFELEKDGVTQPLTRLFERCL